MNVTSFKDRVLDRGFWILDTIVLAMVIATFVLYTRTEFDGYRKIANWPSAPIVTEALIEEAAGLQPRDRIISINGVDVTARPIPRLSDILHQVTSSSSTAEYKIERDGQIALVQVQLHRLDWLTLFKVGGVHFLMPPFFVILASILYLRSGPGLTRRASRVPRYRSARVVCYGFLFAGATIVVASETSIMSGAEWTRLLELLRPTVNGFVFGLLLHFYLIFPERGPGQAPLLPWRVGAIHASHLSVSLAATAYPLAGVWEPRLLVSWRYALVGLFTILTVLIAFRSYRHIASAVQKNQMRWLAWGVAVGLGPWFVFCFPLMLAGRRPVPGYSIAVLWTAFIPISTVVAITRYRLLGIDGFIRRSIVYAVLTAAMSACYVGALAGGAWLVEMISRDSHPVAVTAMTVVLLALAFNPLKRISERLVAGTLYRGAADRREALARFTAATSKSIRLSDIGQVLAADVPRAFTAGGGALVTIENGRPEIAACCSPLRSEVESNLESLATKISARQTLWPDVIYPVLEESGPGEMTLPRGIALCLPLVVGGRLAGLYLLGEKRSNRLYSSDELETLRALGHHAATALDNANAYRRLNRLNEELERIVELRTEQLSQANIELAGKNGVLVKQNTELERLIRQLRETQAALLEAERRAAVGEIIITICHEINNPLSAILGQVQLIEMRSDDPPDRVMERVRVIDQCAEKIRTITEKMRHLQSTKTVTYVGQTKMIDLNQGSMPEARTTSKETSKESVSTAAHTS